MHINTEFFSLCASTTWLIGIIAVLFVALVVESWLAGPHKLGRAWRDVKDVALFGLFVVLFLLLPDDEEQADE